MPDGSSNLNKTYDPAAVEREIYQLWEGSDSFRPSGDPERKPFTIVIPPPNVTGELHMGHALNNTIQDILIRVMRMKGLDALWVPGTDHAGIATQHVVEKHLLEEGTSRQEVGREEFERRVWEWKDQYEARILGQLKRLGSSADWNRTAFTMSDSYSLAVREVFNRLYEKGLIYRGDYLINWCTVCGTALSDLEVEHEETAGRLYHIRYPDETGESEVIVATTRPETMLGDTGIAVHPEDGRYRDMVDRTFVLPLMGRKLPMIADSWVDPEFGTGAVKVTPGHDPNDYEMGQRHGLEVIGVIGEDGLMTAEAGDYAGLDRMRCREKVVEDLEAGGYLVKVEEHSHPVGHCYRCDSTVEPLVSRQWFVKMEPLAEPAIRVVEEGQVKFIPDRFRRVYMNWMTNIRDWCISRQLWWGHRIPAWTCGDCGEITVSRDDPTHCSCGSGHLTQDPDVLDTWFSSALWPFAVFGWPEETPDLKRYFPTDVLVTGYDIIFFWVARMIFSSLEHMGQKPFHTVLLNGLVRAQDGRKMSKSLGTGVDPLELIDQYGADALRFALLVGTTPGNDMRLRPEKLEGARNFCNKLWNAGRFLLMNLEDYSGQPPGQVSDLADRWILSRLSRVTDQVSSQIERMELGEAAGTLHEFLWSEVCDWYLEMAKVRLSSEERPLVQAVLHRVMEQSLRLLHPFMPFITEYLWRQLDRSQDRILMIQDWPRGGERDPEAERDMEMVMETVRAIRNLRADLGLGPGQSTPVQLRSEDPAKARVLGQVRPYVADLARAEPLAVSDGDESPPGQAVAAVAAGVEVYLPWEGLIDPEKERSRLEKELEQTREELGRSERKLQNDGFVKKAPTEVVERERQRLARHREDAERIRRLIRQIS